MQGDRSTENAVDCFGAGPAVLTKAATKTARKEGLTFS